MIILVHDRRKILRFDVTRHPTAAWLSQQVIQASPWDTAPRFLLGDRDASYGSVFSKRVAAMGITEVVTAPRSPWQNAYVERVIGSIRRECLDQFVIFNERHLRHVLASYVDYYHRARTHLSLDKDCPHSRPVQPPPTRQRHRHPASRRAAPPLRTPRSLTAPTNACRWLRGGRYHTVCVFMAFGSRSRDSRIWYGLLRASSSRLVALGFRTGSDFCSKRIFSKDRRTVI